MQRTKELDKHWHGSWWCTTCEMYTGQLVFHQGHNVVRLFNRKDDEGRLSFIPFIAPPPGRIQLYGNLEEFCKHTRRRILQTTGPDYLQINVDWLLQLLDAYDDCRKGK